MAELKIPNSRMKDIALEGGIREILARATELEGQGVRIIHMEIGRPDFDSPQCAKTAAAAAMEAGDVHYTDMNGTPELRAEIAAKYAREQGMDVDPNTQIVVTCGAIESVMAAFFTILEPQDEVIIPTPYFPAYADQIKLADGVLREVQCTMENGYCPAPQDIRAAINNRTKAILVNTPNNPSGAVMDTHRLEEIAAIAKEHDLWVISDECYEKFLYDGTHISMASLPGMAERTITISGASKTWSMTGWRVGWTVMPRRLKPYFSKCHQNLSTCACAFAQAGVAEALRSADSDVTAMVTEYKRRRDMVTDWLSRIKGFRSTVPGGAFYAFPDITAVPMDPVKFCSRLLEEAGVSVVPGSVFGSPGHIRIAYCRDYAYVEEGLSRLFSFCESIR